MTSLLEVRVVISTFVSLWERKGERFEFKVFWVVALFLWAVQWKRCWYGYLLINYFSKHKHFPNYTAAPAAKDWPELPSLTSAGFTRRIVQSEKARLWSYPPSKYWGRSKVGGNRGVSLMSLHVGEGVEGIGASLKPQPPVTGGIQVAAKQVLPVI